MTTEGCKKMTTKPWTLALLVATLVACDDGGGGSSSAADVKTDDGHETADVVSDAIADDALATTDAPSDDAVADAAMDVGPVGDVTGSLDTSEPPAPECPPVTGARPSRRSEHAGVYDPLADRVIFYGGSFAIPENCSFAVAHTFETEIWSYDVACDHWSEIVTAGAGPGGRNRHMTAYDSARHRMLLFGGRHRAGTSGPYTLYGDVWALDLETETWSEVVTSGIGPSGRVSGSLVYDATRDRLLLFGGNQEASGMSYDALNDLWEFDLVTGAWKVLQTSGTKPTARLFTAALWDDARQWMVIFGGADNGAFFDTAEYFNDLYAVDFSAPVPTWQSLNAPGVSLPDGRFWSSMVHDAPRDRYVMFGGHDALSMGNRNDLWAFYPASWAWLELDEADTWNKPANGFCDFPPDFTNVDFDAPERRNAALFVAGGDAAWLMGGKTDCGASDDLVRLDLETDTWEDVTAATVGVSCIRKGGLNCNDLCF